MFAYFLHALTLSVTVIVVSVPEGLPMLVTLVLSSNMRRMLRDNVLVKKMVGIETMGSLNILFTDKTGTLTKGKLEVMSFVLGNGKVFDSLDGVSDKYRDIFVNSLLYNNESEYDNGVVGGNITDRAIMEFIRRKRSDSVKVVDREYFNSGKKYSMVVVNDGDKYYKYVKGASEVVLPKCKYYLNEDGYKQLILNKDDLALNIELVSNRGFRILTVAYSEGISSSDLVLLGFIYIRDDVRETLLRGLV